MVKILLAPDPPAPPAAPDTTIGAAAAGDEDPGPGTFTCRKIQNMVTAVG